MPRAGICDVCLSQPDKTAHSLVMASATVHHRRLAIHRVCATCTSSTTTRPAERIACDSVDCPVFYSRKRAEWDAADVRQQERALAKVFPRIIEVERS